MVSRTLAGSLGLIGDWDLGEDNWKDGMDSNLLKLSALGQGVAKDLVSSTPGVPVEGDVYLFDNTHPTQPGKVAIYDEATWVYVTPIEGWRCYNSADSVMLQFDGTTWVEAGGGTGVPPGGTTGQVLTKLSATDGDADWEDPSGGGGGDGTSSYELIETKTLGANVASVTFSGIAADYEDLVVVWEAKTDTNTDRELRMRFNGDTTNYDGYYENRFATGTATTYMRVGTTQRSSGAQAVYGTVEVFNYKDPTRYRYMIGNSFDFVNDAQIRSGGVWKNTADPVNGITFYTDADNIAAGSQFRLYGRGKVTSGGGSAEREKIATVTVGVGGQATISFTAIPAGYKDLQIAAHAGSETNNSGSTDVVVPRINGDSTGANYDYVVHGAFGSGTGFGNSGGVAFLSCAGTAGVPLVDFTLDVPNYRSATKKNIFSHGMSFQGNVGVCTQIGAASWTGVAPITDLSFTVAGGADFVEGTVFDLYGVRESGASGGSSEWNDLTFTGSSASKWGALPSYQSDTAITVSAGKLLQVRAKIKRASGSDRSLIISSDAETCLKAKRQGDNNWVLSRHATSAGSETTINGGGNYSSGGAFTELLTLNARVVNSAGTDMLVVYATSEINGYKGGNIAANLVPLDTAAVSVWIQASALSDIVECQYRLI